ncbi:MAG: hypothetical protein DRH17_05225 [Deltaproteobacteria bacterium]|nr:MAG: hypothetical protein DRH17_05225 [Deltaproteobacteria bacterium]
MADKQEGLSIIDKGFEMEGTLNVKGKLIICGTVRGTLIGDQVVTAPGSRVFAQANVREMIIRGYFEGDITACESLQILNTGHFLGKIICKNLTVEAGGRLNGGVTPLNSKDAHSPADTIIAAKGMNSGLQQTEDNTEETDPSKPG